MVNATQGSTGLNNFAEKSGVNTRKRQATIQQVLALCDQHDLKSVRLSFADQHGVLRGKTLVIDELTAAMSRGCTMTSSLLAKDTSHKSVFPVWEKGGGLGMSQMQGAGDIIMLPDPSTFKILPWLNKTGWILCDIFFCDGTPVPFSTRKLLQDATTRLSDRHMQLICGLEVEFHVFKLEDPKLSPGDAGAIGAPGIARKVSLLARGFQYLTEQRVDEIEPVSEMLREVCQRLDLPLRSMESEFGPSQFEFTFAPTDALSAADNMMLFKSAVKQVCFRHGLHATFMCRPQVENTFSSGWHLHQSLVDTKTGNNLFVPQTDNQPLSELGMQYTAGLLKHASEAVIFACPTLNGYKRFQPYGLAPDHICWGRDNKGAMVRIISQTDDPASRIENRIGEPAANPYLYFTSQICCGLDGIDNDLSPGPAVENPYECDAEQLPLSLVEAIENLRASTLFRQCLSDQFVDYYLTIKDAEILRFLRTVTDWEQREYFEIF
jgi:glutamine synthetase